MNVAWLWLSARKKLATAATTMSLASLAATTVSPVLLADAKLQFGFLQVRIFLLGPFKTGEAVPPATAALQEKTGPRQRWFSCSIAAQDKMVGHLCYTGPLPAKDEAASGARDQAGNTTVQV